MALEGRESEANPLLRLAGKLGTLERRRRTRRRRGNLNLFEILALPLLRKVCFLLLSLSSRDFGADKRLVHIVHGEMTWNPIAQRWEGNESALREFDHILSSSTRPALITQLSSASPSRLGFPSLPFPRSSSDNPNAPNIPRSNVKVVGSMVFDPSRLSWYSLIPEGEEELDLTMFDGEVADDESGSSIMQGGEDGWEKGEQERMLKNRASFISVMSEESLDLAGRGTGDAGEEGQGVARGLWKESLEAENRHRVEMRGWSQVLPKEDAEEMRREWLFDLRKVRFAFSVVVVVFA